MSQPRSPASSATVVANPPPWYLYFTGPAGSAGTSGAPGTAWREGAGAPSDSVGVQGDLYLNVTNGDVYAKGATAYAVVGNIRGPQGVQGIQGIQGLTGPQGAQGPPGSGSGSGGTATAATQFDVTVYGAVGDGTHDDLAGFQAAVDAAIASSLARGALAFSEVVIPGKLSDYKLSGPVWIKGARVTVRGIGMPSISPLHPYGGPSFVFCGPAAYGDVTSAHRPDAFGILDSSAAGVPGTRYGIRTMGDAVVVMQGDHLQLGGSRPDYNNLYPSYWNLLNSFTFDLFVGRPAGATWIIHAPLIGLAESTGVPAPWRFCASEVPNEIVLLLRTDEADLGPNDYYTVRIPATGAGPWRIAFQFNGITGNYKLILDGNVVTPVVNGPSSFPSRTLRAGLRLHSCNGANGLLIGYAGVGAPQGGQVVTDVAIYGFRVSRGEVYQGGTSLAFATSDNLNGILNDYNRYFAQVQATQTTPFPIFPIGLLPLTDAPGKPWVKTMYAGGYTGLAYWAPTTQIPSFDLALEGVSVNGTHQTNIACGGMIRWALRKCVSKNSLQGFGSIPIGTSYTCFLEDCYLTGADVSYFGWWQTLYARNNYMSGGRQTILEGQSASTWENTFIEFNGQNHEVNYRYLAADYGPYIVMKNFVVDNENGAGTGPIVEISQGADSPAVIFIEDLGVASTGPGPIIHLIGQGVGGSLVAISTDIRRITAFNQYHTVAVQVDGIATYQGKIDLSTLPHGTLAGNVTGNTQYLTLIPAGSIPPNR